QKGTASVSFTTTRPSPPAVSISAPRDFDWLSAAAPSYVDGNVATVGALAGFCVVANRSAVPGMAQCQKDLSGARYLGSQPIAFGVFLPASQFQMGANKISAFAYDRWGQVGRADVAVNTPTDFRIVGMEISQGIQTSAIPLNTTGSSPYSGVKLRAGVPTV